MTWLWWDGADNHFKRGAARPGPPDSDHGVQKQLLQRHSPSTCSLWVGKVVEQGRVEVQMCAQAAMRVSRMG